MKSGLPTILLVLWLGWISSPLSWSIEIPPETLADLRSEEFHKREAAQGRLLEWARGHGDAATDELFRQSREASDPEVRERCLGALRDLVNDAYLNDGKGYIGIKMQDEIVGNIPGDPKARAVIRVTQVMPDSAAEEAGLQLNDLIVGLGDEVWHQAGATLPFGEKIREMKPRTKVKLKVLRDDKLLDIEVKLHRRPLYADNLFFDGRQEDLEAAELEAKELYFRRWLEQRKARK